MHQFVSIREEEAEAARHGRFDRILRGNRGGIPPVGRLAGCGIAGAFGHRAQGFWLCPAARPARHRGSLVARPGQMPEEAAEARRPRAAGESTRPARVGTAMQLVMQSFSYSLGTSSDGLDVPPVQRRDAPLFNPGLREVSHGNYKHSQPPGNSPSHPADTMDDRATRSSAT